MLDLYVLLVNFLYFLMILETNKIIWLYTGSIFTIFSPNSGHLMVDYRSGLLFFDPLRDVAVTTNFGTKSPNNLHLSQWHSKTDWNVTI